jgi:hypothetical protein
MVIAIKIIVASALADGAFRSRGEVLCLGIGARPKSALEKYLF